MKKIVGIVSALLSACLLAFAPTAGAVQVFTTAPEWAALVREIGGEDVIVSVATTGLQDPHRIQAKPSLITAARSADLVVANGAELEVAWLPLVIRASGNAQIQPGRPGYFEAAAYVRLIEAPVLLDRSQGDVHPLGNPHIHGDPRNMLSVGRALAARLAQIDPKNAAAYSNRYKRFTGTMRASIAVWERDAAPLRGVPILVQHKVFSYLESWLGIEEAGALEAIPGVEPSGAHLAEILARQAGNPARMVVYPAYQDDAPSRWVGERAKIPVVLLPSTLGGTPDASNLYKYYESMVRRLLDGLKSGGGAQNGESRVLE
ncbi:MAG: zinc ABC transporter substrate-binding protein [Candidatus Accumulibacter sp.]|jgi:zinc/manganese transport system substrate-binding protein|nr:zinc ABC transporter substrate-binding protein [Accumulibacter sp.]